MAAEKDAQAKENTAKVNAEVCNHMANALRGMMAKKSNKTTMSARNAGVSLSS